MPDIQSKPELDSFIPSSKYFSFSDGESNMYAKALFGKPLEVKEDFSDEEPLIDIEKVCAKNENAREYSGKFLEDFLSANSVLDQFQKMQDFRHEQLHECIAIEALGETMGYDGPYAAYTVLQEASRQTDSVYIHRLAEWGKNQILHELALHNNLYDSNVQGEEWEGWFYDGKTPQDLHVTLTPSAQAVIDKHPEYEDMLMYGKKLYEANPTLGDVDYYTPSPYDTLTSKEYVSATERDEKLLLTIETAALFETSLADLPAESRDKLFQVSVQFNEDIYEGIKKVTAKLPPDLHLNFAKAFLFASGADMMHANQMLSIATHLEETEFRDLLHMLGSFQDDGTYYARTFAGSDPDLEQAIVRSEDENLCKALSMIDFTSKNGSGTVNIQPNQTPGDLTARTRREKYLVTYDSAREILDDMSIRAKGMSQGRSILTDPKAVCTPVVMPGQGFQIYRINSDKGSMIIHTRREGSSRFSPSFEYGNNNGVEASCDISVYMGGEDTAAPDVKSPDMVSVFRIDREGRQSHEAPNAPSRHAINQLGLASFDTGSVSGSKNSLAFRSSVPFAGGDAMAAREGLQHTISLHHNAKHFSSELGSAEGFMKFIDGVDAQLHTLYVSTQHRIGAVASAHSSAEQSRKARLQDPQEVTV